MRGDSADRLFLVEIMASVLTVAVTGHRLTASYVKPLKPLFYKPKTKGPWP